MDIVDYFAFGLLIVMFLAVVKGLARHNP
jgi:hypothetical protein